MIWVMKMANAKYLSSFSNFSHFQTSRLMLETRHGWNMVGKSLGRRSLKIKAEVNFVNAEEAKKLIAVEGYAVLDVRDKSQYNRSHIKSCYHVPLFIENEDNDLGELTIFSSRVHLQDCGLVDSLIQTLFGPHCRHNRKEDSPQQFFWPILWIAIHKTQPRVCTVC